MNLLMVISGGCLVLDTKQLARAIGWNYTTISEMRSLGQFPIKHILRGKRPVYPVQNVISYLMDKPQDEGTTKPKKQPKPSTVRKYGGSGLPDMSRLAFMSGLAQSCEEIESSVNRAKNELLAQISFEELEGVLPKKTVNSTPKIKI